MANALSIVCCTRDRPQELRRLMESVVQARAGVSDMPVEFLVIDDGNLSVDSVSLLETRISAAGMAWRYVNKRERSGLLRSRIEAVALTRHDWILFLDDDLEIEPDYFVHLMRCVDAHPGLAGIGGVDLLETAQPGWKFLTCFLCGLQPLRLGRLSIGGFPPHMYRARDARRRFFASRVYGCNMAFRKSALRGLQLLPDFDGYSLYEDAYLSFQASQSGPLVVDPDLKVRHHHSPLSRDKSFAVGRMSVLNHYRLMQIYGVARWRLVPIFLSLLALILASGAKGVWKNEDSDFMRGQLSAFGDSLRMALRGTEVHQR